MSHLNEEQLILHFYGEGETAEAESHLASCAICAGQFAGLRRELALLNTLDAPERDAEYETHVWNRLRWRLGRPRPARRWVPLSAAAGLLLAAVIGTQWWINRTANAQREIVPISVVKSEPPKSDRLLVLVVNEHFGRSARLLLEISNAKPTGDIDLGPHQESAQDLLDANRLYRQTATQSGDHSVGSILEELEPILLQVARAESTPEDLRSLQRRIESRGLVFKLRVLAETDAAQSLRSQI
jgi:hypothetical protein